ncbi:hypothetical protein EU527_07240 [Candidatus Thorarchaeota archaeon]|nr:MAG: hypothetical protein EU527_07240 [Candidatus Thorarchaeota archaeon]
MNLKTLLTCSEKPLIMGHQNADPDAVCAMIAFSRLYKVLNPNGNPSLMADDLSRLSNQVLVYFEVDDTILEEPRTKFDLVILLDTNSVFQLGPCFQEIPSEPSKTVIIDHHEPTSEAENVADYRIVKNDRFSTCEIIVQLYNELGIPIDANTANLLLTGILFDTRRFLYTDLQTLHIVMDLIRSGAQYERCIKSLQIKPDRSERIARLKAAGRMAVHLFDEWVVVSSTINAFEASACRSLVEMGADVAIIGGRPSKDVVRLSSRSTTDFYHQTGINLGTDIMEPLGELIQGKGGGHANAAGANGRKNLKKALDRAVELIRLAIEKQSYSNPGS